MNAKCFKLLNVKTISIFMLIVFCLDRIFKSVALEGRIFFYKNFNLAFSIKISENLIPFFHALIFIILILIGCLFARSLKRKNNLLLLASGLLFIGTTSNLIDRIKFGFVIDYFNFVFFYNNLADIFIIIGLLIMFWKLIFKKLKA